AVDKVKTFRSEGQRENVGLHGDEIACGKVLGCHFRSRAEIDADDTRTPTGRNFGEAAHAASHIENQFALEFFGPQRGFHPKIEVRLADLVVIELRLLIPVPLEAETGGVMLGIYEARNAIYVGILALACRAHVASA